MEKDLVPYIPYFLESLLLTLNKNVISMYDEAVYSNYLSHPNFLIRHGTKGKIEKIMRRSKSVFAWNPIVEEYACRFNDNVTAVTTGIDMKRYVAKSDYTIENPAD